MKTMTIAYISFEAGCAESWETNGRVGVSIFGMRQFRLEWTFPIVYFFIFFVPVQAYCVCISLYFWVYYFFHAFSIRFLPCTCDWSTKWQQYFAAFIFVRFFLWPHLLLSTWGKFLTTMGTSQSSRKHFSQSGDASSQLRSPSLSTIPSDVIEKHVFHQLSTISLVACSQTCVTFRKIASKLLPPSGSRSSKYEKQLSILKEIFRDCGIFNCGRGFVQSIDTLN